MPDREKVAKDLADIGSWIAGRVGFEMARNFLHTIDDAVAMLKEQESLLGVRQTADDITFISTGTAQKGEERGIMLGKAFMHEWIYKELIHKDLLTDEIRLVFDQAKHI